MHWLATAPANIALIKYMGKRNEHSNLPDNASISYTLPHLLSTVRLELITAAEDQWQPLLQANQPIINISPAGQKTIY